MKPKNGPMPTTVVGLQTKRDGLLKDTLRAARSDNSTSSKVTVKANDSMEHASTVARLVTAVATAGATKEQAKATANDNTMEKEKPRCYGGRQRKGKEEASTRSTIMRSRRSRKH